MRPVECPLAATRATNLSQGGRLRSRQWYRSMTARLGSEPLDVRPSLRVAQAQDEASEQNRRSGDGASTGEAFEGEEDLEHADELRRARLEEEEQLAKAKALQEEKERRVKSSMEREAALKISKVSLQEVLSSEKDIGSFSDIVVEGEQE
eukprot:scaffold2502_cov362-Prasinococcus_capsulatus_cf.AAC.7